MALCAKNAFTLLELIIAIIVLGIVAGISIPEYTKLKERTLGKEARLNLKLIGAAERAYHSDYGTYLDCRCADYAVCNDTSDVSVGCNTLLRLNLNIKNWHYNVDSATKDNFNAQASRVSSGCVYTLTALDNEPSSDNCP